MISDSFLDAKAIMNLIERKQIADLPSEVLQKGIFVYLTCKDVRSLGIGMIEGRRIKHITADYLKRTCDVFCSRILIAGGWVNKRMVSTAYIMEIHFDLHSDKIVEVSYKGVPNIPNRDEGLFACKCDGRSVIGVGKEDSTEVYELQKNKWKSLPNRNFSRYQTASCYINKTLIVSGGYQSDQLNRPIGNVDIIETIDITASDTGAEWKICPIKLPIQIATHTLTDLEGQLVMIGGKVAGNPTNAAWAGNIITQQEIEWKSLEPMKNQRSMHFSLLVDTKIYVFGGDGNETQTVEIFDGNVWEIGPEIPFYLTTANSQAGVDKKNRIIIISKLHGIIVYNTTTGDIHSNKEFNLKEDRQYYASLFL